MIECQAGRIGGGGVPSGARAGARSGAPNGDEAALEVVPSREVPREAGYRHVGWNVAGLDWPTERTGAEVEAAIRGVVRPLRAAGAEFVRIDELPIKRVPKIAVPDATDVSPSPA